jgi:hypothetical protein
MPPTVRDEKESCVAHRSAALGEDRRRIFPLALRGSSPTNRQEAGTLKPARSRRANARSSSGLAIQQLVIARQLTRVADR